MGIINNKTIFCNYIIFFQVVSDVSCLNSSISEGESGLSSERRENQASTNLLSEVTNTGAIPSYISKKHQGCPDIMMITCELCVYCVYIFDFKVYIHCYDFRWTCIL